MIGKLAGLAFSVAIATQCHAQAGPAMAAPAPDPAGSASALTEHAHWHALGGPRRQIDLTPAPLTVEDVIVTVRHHSPDAEWRADVAAQAPAYEAPSSAAARQIYARPFGWTSPEQQRLMSTKTELLGLCNGLGGYIQCPNLAP